ncbi:hypothetical protein ON010_g2732 [Phytophthora cinnamomi]|nr:hypothetical protein ON010_g2732 [Phytophthora cinnamomi]
MAAVAGGGSLVDYQAVRSVRQSSTAAEKNSQKGGGGRVVKARQERDFVREWLNLRGGGCLCESYVVSSAGDMFRITVFNEAVARFCDIVLPVKACRFYLDRIKPAKFEDTGSTYEATIGADADIQELDGDQAVSKDPLVAFTPLSNIAALHAGAIITITGIIHATGNITRFTNSKGKRVKERKPVVLSGAQITDYNGSRSVKVGSSTTVLFGPATARSESFRHWYAALDTNIAFSAAGG